MLNSTFATSIAIKVGGDDRDRTCGPLNANQMLYQLSYTPRKSITYLFIAKGSRNLVYRLIVVNKDLYNYVRKFKLFL
jgi:hypothetical protein